ncbi:amidase domain-containing protein [Paenibacillus sp. strain BS8-2]
MSKSINRTGAASDRQKRPAKQAVTASALEKRARPEASTERRGMPVEKARKQEQKLSALLQSSGIARDQSSSLKDWKSAIQRYIRLFNQAETDQHARVLFDYVLDSVHNERFTRRMDRLRERDLLRGVIPAGSETKAELIRVNESAGEVSILLKLHIKRKMKQGGLTYSEERYELERLWLRLEDGDWQVQQIEPVIAERRPKYGASVLEWQEDGELSPDAATTIAPSMPYLNYDLMPGFKLRSAGIRYRRDLAAAYADRWWNAGNPTYELFEVNCTNYVSQCIFAGNAAMDYTGRRGSGWWYKGRNKGQEWWSYSWAVSNSLNVFLSAARKSGLRAVTVQSANELQLGDVITYDWNGDGRFQHSTIVTAFDSAGQPLVNANTVASRHRYWDYRDSYAWTPATQYRFFHISDWV